MKNRRLKYDSDYIRICSRNFDIDNKYKIKSSSNSYFFIKKDNLDKVYRKNNSKEMTISRLFQQKNFQDIQIDIIQKNELQKIIDNFNKGELINWNTVKNLLLSNVKNKFVERYRLLINFKSSDALHNYTIRFGYEEGKIRHTKLKRDRLKGENNPAYNHGGKYSPYSKKFIKYKDLSEDKVEKNIERLNLKNKESQLNNGNNKRTLKYWLKITKGNEEEAKKLLSEFQSNYSKDIYFQKYQYEEAIEKIEEIKNKKRETFYSKTEEERNEINMKRASSIGKFVNGKYTVNEEYKDKDGILYYFQFTDEDGKDYWKIGISSKTFNERFPKNIREHYNIRDIEITEDILKNCAYYEQMILKIYKKYRKRTTLTTESFIKDIKNGF